MFNERKSKKDKFLSIDLTPAFNHALDLMENTTNHIFITGRAGTGKSTLLNYFKSCTQKNIAVLAPTGVAALNVKGQTIHSFFKFKANITLENVKKNYGGNEIYKKLDAIVIDEISMVRCDLLDCVDKFLRINGRCSTSPFGGVQMIFIGDLHQLPPVVTYADREIFHTKYQTPYFFSAHFFDDFQMEFVELDKIYRQKDTSFIDLLNAIRDKKITQQDMILLNQRVTKNYKVGDSYIYLTPKNQNAEDINEEKLAELTSPVYTFDAKINGTFGKEYFPTKQTLKLKKDSQVMLVNNDSKKRWINGTMGKIFSITEEQGEIVIIVMLENGQKVTVRPYTWDIFQFSLEEDVIKTESVGSFIQYPLMLAWALTIHKSQGKTFHKVILDIGKGAFMPGQVYVALSRCTTLEGIVLTSPIKNKDIWIDYNVVSFLKKFKS